MDEIPVEKIVRSRRRTIALIINSEARLIVRAPMKASLEVINAVIREKQCWIRKKVAEMKQRPPVTVHRYEEGEIFFFLGRAYPLHIIEDGRGVIERTDRLCVSRMGEADISRRIKRWYIGEAQKEIRSRCMWFSMTTGYTPASVRITDARGRWGSCTHRGGLNFSWRLIQAPLEIVDYVIVHELVHLRQPDHSRKFWAKVREIMPDYERRREWLRENERLLRI
ncbi:SprT family zinc-dependent metalloprotease [uncultured Methanoregula sp.]|uniref:M48 family metallopeptidase n=1 Tax=uncultured Methanoregula sp. TaxID=1005933 RepID=UPI002AAAE230|nr:SprT family zinc-dependent metalloprotease [uncultured Methanoregula sp.]